MRKVTHSRTSQVIHAPIEKVWEFVTVPNNWVKLQLGTWMVHGSGGLDDVASVSRTMQPGEHFIEYMHMPDRFDLVGDWEVTKCEAPTQWGFKSVHWYGPAMPTDMDVTYTLEKVDDNTTRWSRHRVTTSRPGKENTIDFLDDKNDLEDEYQAVTRRFLEDGIPNSPPYNPTPPHDRNWLQTLPCDA